MPTHIEMPKLSDTMTEGTLVKWLKKEGDAVAMDEPVAEIETDKATMEMQSFDEGILHKIYVQEGESAPLGAVLALLLAEGEEAPADADTQPAARGSSGEAEPPSGGEDAGEEKDDGKSQAEPPAPDAAGEGDRIKASPLAKKIAGESGVDLASVSGTGPGGRIVKQDVLAASSARPSSPAGRTRPAAPAAEDQRIPLTGMRRVIAERLLESKTSIPHFYLHVEIDAAPLMELRRQINAEAEKSGGNRFTVNDFVLKAAVQAARAVPAVNASFDGDAIIQYGEVHLAVAVAVEQGLVTPVIRSAQNLGFAEMSLAMKELAEKARSKKLSPAEMQGGTMTISNLGSYGIESFDAIINPPQSLILSVGAIVKKPVVNSRDEIVPGLRLDIGLSGDHRVVDGAVGAEYLAALRRYLEQPVLLLL